MSIIEGKNNDFIEENCIFDFQGKQIKYGGSYLLKRKDNNLREGILYLFTTTYEDGRYKDFHVGTWDGSKKVHAIRLNSWTSNFGDTRHHFWFIWDKVKFWGINAGDNDIVRCREYKNQD